MDALSDEIPADVAESLEDHVDDALEHAADESALFHLRHAKQLLIHLDAEAGDVTDAAEEATGEQSRTDAD